MDKPFLLWTYHKYLLTTGVSPFQILCSWCPSPQLSIMKNSWTDDIPIPFGQLKSITNNLNKLMIKLKLNAKQASFTSTTKQATYTICYNHPKRYKISK